MDASFWDDLIFAFSLIQDWELLAMLLGLAYVFLIIKENIWAWPAAFISTAIYTVLFWDGQLPLQSVLNFYYLGMAVYGFWLWKQPVQASHFTEIGSRPLSFHIKFVLFGLLLSIALGWFNETYVQSKLPYLDAGVLVFSVLNTMLMVQKVLESWLYWLAIDAAAIVLYWQAEFYVTIILFMVYLVMAVVGYFEWRAKLSNQVQASKLG